MESSSFCEVNKQKKGQIPLCIGFCLGHMGCCDCILPVLKASFHTEYAVTAASTNGAFLMESQSDHHGLQGALKENGFHL